MENWKTTATGASAAILIALADVLTTGGVITVKTVATAIGIALLGWFAKDGESKNDK